MQFPKLSPLQSRFVASLVASVILLLLYLSLTKPQFAYAADLETRIPPDHNHPIIPDGDSLFDDDEPNDAAQSGGISPRAAQGVSALANNDAQNMNINIGELQNWVFPEDAINGERGAIGPGLPSSKSVEKRLELHHELRKRQDQVTVYITINTCLQPSLNITSTDADSDTTLAPQLELYVSRSDSNQTPGPGSSDEDQQTIKVDGGYALVTLNASTDIYIGIAAPNTTSFTGIYNYEIAASNDAPFHGAVTSSANLFFVDSDNHAALLITNDTTQDWPNSTVYQEWMSMRPPYGMFAHNQEDRTIMGVRNSYCGLQNNAQITANLEGVNNQNVAGMTNRGLGGKPKEQFYITALDASSTYWGFLAMEGNSTASGNGIVGGGGKVWAAMNFTTKVESNCALMYNLSFCSEVAYAVPSNPHKYSQRTGYNDLANVYDGYAKEMYRFFDYSLQQIPCNTTSTAQYSLARNCDDCARAYKQWLCAVTIPRCEDYINDAPWLMPRNTAQKFINGSSISPSSSMDQALLDNIATNSSRNPIIDETIQPGPYKEVLPCQDLCWDLVQSCPAALQFACPLPGAGLEDSYHARSNNSGIIKCSYLGAAYYLSGAERTLHLRPGVALAVALGVLAVLS